MGASAGIMMAGSAASEGISNYGNAYTQAQATRAQGDYQKSMFDTNARLAEMQGEDAIRRGDNTASAIAAKGRQTVGAQRAAYAAQGIDVNTGSAADIQAETNTMSAMDALTAKNNAWREAWGFKVQANDLSARGKMTKHAADTSAKNTLLVGGMQAVSSGMKAGSYASGGKPGSAAKS